MFLVLIAVVYFLRCREADVIRKRAGEFASAGWLTPQEVHMLGSFQERARAIRWASSIGRADAMRDLQRTATRLAYNRERAASGRVQISDWADQDRLLQELTAQRTAVYGTPVA